MSKKAKYSGDTIFCIVTGAPGATLHHIRTQGAGGGDEPHNLMPLCHRLHLLAHQWGMKKMAATYPKIDEWLRKNRWYFDERYKKWLNLKDGSGVGDIEAIG